MKKIALSILAAAALTGSIASVAQAYPAYGQYSKEIPYRVIGVAYNDVLNMRSGPGVNRHIVNFLHPGENGVYVRWCSKWVNWCQVQSGHKVGWVNMRYLSGYAY